jgi:glyoxylase-like metal-dependent hydrolase (beta-lactamase superfamily II)
VLGESDSHAVPWIDRLRRLEQLDPDLLVPGHGHLGGPERIAGYLAYPELARRRVSELRATGELTEPEITDRVTAEVLDMVTASVVVTFTAAPRMRAALEAAGHQAAGDAARAIRGYASWSAGLRACQDPGARCARRRGDR